jgi:hypothetical protein
MNLYAKIGIGVGGGLIAGFGAGRYSMRNKVKTVQADYEATIAKATVKISEHATKAIQEEFKKIADMLGVDIASLPKSKAA